MVLLIKSVLIRHPEAYLYSYSGALQLL